MATKTPQKTVEFIATQYRNQPVQVKFYTRTGSRIDFVGTKKVPVKTKVKFGAHK